LYIQMYFYMFRILMYLRIKMLSGSKQIGIGIQIKL